MSYLATPAKPPVTLSTLNKLKAKGEKFSCLTCYDASFAHAMDQAGIETILVGDSLGMVVQGHDSTLPVTVADMAYHTANIARANRTALILCDLPFLSYATLSDAINSSRAVMQAGANVVKIEGGRELARLVTDREVALVRQHRLADDLMRNVQELLAFLPGRMGPTQGFQHR